ncbi:DUF866-domain-containing protein [Cystobasidium minutum MCA 4210]|uniref:DUF866-domain-containing protein n=1 Tax=Cystobasidium minutum MCA 4210 TaxID=1397322 RepID=UPI0034CDB0A1|eukprot:jgi/Rhomi1/61082/CE61081_1603
MVKLKLSFKAALENVTDLEPSSIDYTFFCKVQCSSCREVHPNVIGITRSEEREISGSRGTANFVFRCDFCKRESSVVFDDPKGKSPVNGVHTLEKSEVNQASTLAVFECRGCEFVDFEPRGSWKCKGAESGTVFEDVEFEDGRWDDYDEKAGVPVSISEISAKFERT